MSMDEIPKRWPLVTNPGNRYGYPNIDSRMVNFYAEKDPQYGEYDLYRRPGLEVLELLDGFTDFGRGISYWNPVFGTEYLMQVRSTGSASNLYLNTTDLGSVADGAVYDFSPVQSSTPGLFLKSGPNGYVTDGATITQITDAAWQSFDQDLMPGVASLNGRLYVLAAPNRVYGALNLNDGLNWSSLNLILANASPDYGTYIVRHLQYILVMKSLSTEVFQDVGNASGSPLAAVQGISIPFGCVAPKSVIRINDSTFWVATSRNSAQEGSFRQVVMMSDLVPQVVSSPRVDRILASYQAVTGGYPLLIAGHKFYCVELYTGSGYLTLAYDVTEGLWSEWIFPTSLLGAAGGPYGYVLQQTSGKPLSISTGLYYDVVDSDEIAITSEVYTSNMDFGADRVKYLGALLFTGDQTKGTQLQVRRSDDDFQTWSNFRTVNLGEKKPKLVDEGSFYRRAYHIRFNQTGPMRLRSLGLQMELGVL